MDQVNLLCLSLAPNLRCVGLTFGQFTTLLIPIAVEVIISFLFIYLYSGPSRRAQIFLAADGILYFLWTLLDMLSHVVPPARISLSVLKVFDLLVGVVSFTPILIYAIYLYRLSFLYFIPILPLKLRPYLEISLPVLLVIIVALNEVSSFVGTHFGPTPSNQPLVVMFSDNSEFLWLCLSRSSLIMWTFIQFLFFFLALSRLSRAALDERQTKLTQLDEHNGIAWISMGIIFGVVETITGLSQVDFGVTLARRILRLVARTTLMFGLFKGLDPADNVESLTNGPDDVSRTSKHISRILGINPQQTHMFCRISQPLSEQSRTDDYSSSEKQPREQRVTIHHEKGHAPSLQIRFSTLEFPAHGILAGNSPESHGKNFSDEMTATRNTMPETPPRAKSAPATSNGHYVPPDWPLRPITNYTTQSDSPSIVRDLERKFPSPSPEKCRGSVPGQAYDKYPFPVVVPNPNEEGIPVALRSSSSIKRKPPPPLLENVAYISDECKRPASTWGGLTQNPMDSSAVSNSPWEGSTVYSPGTTLVGEPSTPRSRRTTNRNIFKRASRALSDASIRSAEWLASTMSSQSARMPLTAVDIEMYRRGNLGPGSARPTPSPGEVSLSSGKPLPKGSKRFTDDARIHS